MALFSQINLYVYPLFAPFLFFLPASTLCTSVSSEFREEIQTDGGPLQRGWLVLTGNNRNLHFPT